MHRAGAGRRVARVHDRDREEGRADHLRGQGRRRGVRGDGLQLLGRGAEQRHDLHPPQGLRGAAESGSVARGGAAAIERAAVHDSGRDRRGVPAAVDPGPVAVRRLPVRSARSDRLDRHQHAGRRDLRLDGRRQPERPGAGRVQQLPRRRSAADRRHRSRQGAQPRPAAARGHRRAAGVPRLAVRQRLRLQQPRLSRLRAGGSALPRQPGEPEAALRARVERRHDPARQRGAPARDDRAAGDQPLQPVPLGGNHRQPRAGAQLGPDARCDGGARAREPAAGFDFAWSGQSLEERLRRRAGRA